MIGIKKLNKTESKIIMEYLANHLYDFPQELKWSVDAFKTSYNFVHCGLDHKELLKKPSEFYGDVVKDIQRMLVNKGLNHPEIVFVIEYLRAIIHFSLLLSTIPEEKQIMILGRKFEDLDEIK